MLMLECPHCGAKSDEPTIIETKKHNYAECNWCGLIIKELNHNDTMIIKGNRGKIK